MRIRLEREVAEPIRPGSRFTGWGRTRNWFFGFSLLTLCYLAAPDALWACPNCKNAFRAGVDRAYAASILFMLGMPFALLGAWGLAILRMIRRRV